MWFEGYLLEIKTIQNMILDCIDDDDENLDKNIESLHRKFLDSTFPNNKYKMIEIFQIIVSIANEYHRGPNFYTKIEQILHLFVKEIKSFNNSEIFEIFKSNQRIILYLIKEKLLIVNETFVDKISKFDQSYCQYFAPEIKEFIENQRMLELPENFEECREIGENDSYICKLIREDSVQDFIIYVNKENYSLDHCVPESIFETNRLLKMRTSLIEYTAFYGSIQIFQYLKMQNVPLTEYLWIYAIHSNNPEIISICDDEIQEKSFIQNAFFESIKSFHHDIATYLKENNNMSNLHSGSKIYNDEILKSHNYEYINYDFINDKNSFCYLCLYNYCWIVHMLVKEGNIDVNQETIDHKRVLLHFKINFT